MANHQEVNLQAVVSDKLLLVPDYQRPYAWGQGQLDDLWEDLDVLGPHGRHYTGTLVLLPQIVPPVRAAFGQTLKPTDVVDGQQRLTTCLILVDRIRRAFELLATKGVDDAAETGGHIRETYGLVKVQGAQRPRLQLGKDFNQFWVDSVLADHQSSLSRPTAGHERIQAAADYFDRKIATLLGESDDHAAYERLQDLLTRVTDGLKFLVYDVDSSAEVGVIFETLNGRGKPLSELEKIKNYLLFIVRSLAGDRADELTSLINTEWAGIFTDLAGLGIDEDRLLRAHWLATQNPDARTWSGAQAVKSLFSRRKYVRDADRLASASTDNGLTDPDGAAIETYVRSLRLCALFTKETWDPSAAFTGFASHHNDARSRSAALRRSRNVANFQPLLFASRLAHPHDGAAYVSLVQASETYAARVYTIAQKRSNAGQNRLYGIAHRVGSGELAVNDAVREIDELAWSYANDEQVRTSLAITEKWYNRPGHKYFLYEYELFLLPKGALEPNYTDFVGTKYNQTTEHILPQNPDWARDDWSTFVTLSEHAFLQHSLANLVLTFDNSSYSNKGFAAKKGQFGQAGPSYSTSSLRQEQEIATYATWFRADMERRLDKLRNFALQRWPVQPPTLAAATAVDQLADANEPMDDDGDPDGDTIAERGTT